LWIAALLLLSVVPTRASAVCGDGIIDFDKGELCDPADVENGDCCSSTCVPAPAGTPCASDGNPCTDDKCNSDGVCLNVNNTVPCDDGKFCTVNDMCRNRECDGMPRDCSAVSSGLECQAGSCDEETDSCFLELLDGTPCDDGNLCTQTDLCQAGTCVGADPVVCAPPDQCYDAGTCDPASGLCSERAKPDGSACDDGDPCTQTDLCQAGVCVGADPVVCSPSDDCHLAGTCDPETGVCSDPVKADGAECDDGDLCTQTDQCQSGTCVGAEPVICSALDQCHVPGTCDPETGMCSNPIQANGTPCDDQSLCTLADSCQGGVCEGDAVVCTALDQCHDPGVCEPMTGECSNPEKTDGTGCDDGDLCTVTDMCIVGRCVGSDPVVCQPLDACHLAGVCDPATGECSNPEKENGTECEDGDLCTRSGSCEAGTCVGGDSVVCSPLDQCHVAGTCDPATGQCSNPAAEDGTGCDDESLCTLADRCEAGACVGDAVVCTPPTDCHEVGTCDPATGECSVAVKPEGAPCEDGDLCTRTGACAAGTCVGDDPVVCTALDQCHVAGACDPATGECSNPAKPNGTACDDESLCTAGETCQAGMCTGSAVTCTPRDQCHVAGTCDPATGECSDPPAADGTACDDGDLCTQGDACQAGGCAAGEPVVCAPADDCHVAGTCDPATGECSTPVAADGTACDDGDLCTRSSLCEAGTCVGSDPVICVAFDDCHEAGVCDPATGTCSNPERPDENLTVHEAAADAHTDEDLPFTSFGADETLRVDTSPKRHIFLRFVVEGIDAPVTSATLRLRTTPDASAGSPAGGTVRMMSDTSWDEMAVTYEARPPIDGPELSSAGAVTPSQDVDFDVTAAVTGDGTYAFAIVPDSSNAAFYHSREAAAGGPLLLITSASTCDDGDLCTRTSTCEAGRCVGSDPVECAALDQCHDAGTCDPATGLCSDPAKADGSGCDDGDLCTRLDACQEGSCTGFDPVECAALDQCHEAGTCDPATGTCSNPNRSDGTACDDGDLCTRLDTCQEGMCTGFDPVECAARDQCHDAGTCDPAMGQCSNPVRLDGSGCDDGDLCTRLDTCQEGSCTGGDRVQCAALDQCHEAGTCDPATGTCSNPDRPDGTACDDGDLCTWLDTCQEGSCTGFDPVECTALDQCHEAGTCDPATGTCSNPNRSDGTACDDGAFCTVADACQGGVCQGAPRDCGEAGDVCREGVCDEAADACQARPLVDGASCDDGNLCTRTDTCQAGVCTGADAVVCPLPDQCHDAGVCDPATGTCSNPNRPDGTACDDGDPCSTGDVCVAGICLGEEGPDVDADAFCDAVDVCPGIPDPQQLDTDHDGRGDACTCTAPAPGRCLAGGGTARADCLLEFASFGPPSLNRRGTKVKPVLTCTDGDPACDLDGARDGQCTFGVALCFGNTDPRLPRCVPDRVRSTEVRSPKAGKKGPVLDARNLEALESALGAMGLEVRRGAHVITTERGPVGTDVCGPLVRLVAPAPGRSKATPRRFQVRATSVGGKRDDDRFTLVCR
jgi:hypothetical protein